jgi:type I restriction enzyme M protein
MAWKWLERRRETLAELKKQIPSLQTYLKGGGEKIADWKLLERSIFGIEASQQMMRISMMNLMLHGIRNASMKRANALSEVGGLTEKDLKRSYQVILCDPPLGGVISKDSIRKDSLPLPIECELLFLGLIMIPLRPADAPPC